ncbi:hypothetical protein [Natrinema salaciae]|uniref:hypothetical protein n=1 Tax=Natrinema salaciae TaxID=1186196 RepID=UPI000B8273D1|nr:hypothetical protein [Natrinema salaciae]
MSDIEWPQQLTRWSRSLERGRDECEGVPFDPRRTIRMAIENRDVSWRTVYVSLDRFDVATRRAREL